MAHTKTSKLEEEFGRQCARFQLPAWEREYEFAKQAFGRRYRLDFFWPKYRLGVELHGLVVVPSAAGAQIVRGGHGTVPGMIRDMDKANAAILLGISVLVFCQRHVESGDAIAMTQRALTVKGWKRSAL
jgi:hypothetical protein